MLLTRAPLYRGRSPFSFDLHVLSAPLTFVLSQDQTLQLNLLNVRSSLDDLRCSVLFDGCCYSSTSRRFHSNPALHRPVAYNPVFKDRLGSPLPKGGAVYRASFSLSTLFFAHPSEGFFLPPVGDARSNRLRFRCQPICLSAVTFSSPASIPLHRALPSAARLWFAHGSARPAT